jgi:hypothetical protein
MRHFAKYSCGPQIDGPTRLGGHEIQSGMLLGWQGIPRTAGIVAFDLYAMILTPQGPKPLKINAEPLPVEGSFVDTHYISPPLPEHDPLDELLERPSGPPLETVAPSFIQTWVDFIGTLPASPLRPYCPREEGRTVRPGEYFLVGLFENGECDGTILAEDRLWTPKDEADRDRRIREAMEEIKRRGLIEKLPGGLTYEDFVKHIEGGVRGDKGELGKTQGRTWPDKKNPGTGNTTSTVTINGNDALDLCNEVLIALILHECVHAIQNLTRTIPTGLKEIAIQSIENEIGAYSSIWDLITNGDLKLRPFWQAMEAIEAISAIISRYRKFAQILIELESELTDAQKTAIRSLRQKVKELLQKYQQFLRTVPQGIGLPAVSGPNGQQMSPTEYVDWLLNHPFK